MSGIVIGELQAFPGKTINIRGLNDFLAVATQVAVAEVIHHDINNIGWVRCRWERCKPEKTEGYQTGGVVFHRKIKVGVQGLARA